MVMYTQKSTLLSIILFFPFTELHVVGSSPHFPFLPWFKEVLSV